MIKIASLGPVNTFSEMAAHKFGMEINSDFVIELFPTIGKAFKAVGETCDFVVLPIENMAEGYVSIVLDLLAKSNLYITHELLLPIQFSFVANSKSLDKIEKVYAQFVTQGQCATFLDNLDDITVITTQSNGTSFKEVRKGMKNEGAIIPAFAVEENDFPIVTKNIADNSNNMTRFIAIGPQQAEHDPRKGYKTTVLIMESIDRPGMLSDILAAFSTREINLVSIMSRPTKEILGRYHFFIDVEGYSEENHIKEALSDIMKENTVRLLGSYEIARPITGGPDKAENSNN
ncbi:prephenate dehydratase [Spirochaetota bacterium]